ncbi:hypothetical protein [Candidatus Enterococcus mansonii]|uniref:DUF5067 domain-containing protein n=1 Tax=Candidatus Enterococcus mansonii TaxID=1834181 RepID=A0A242CCN6_9ENTE|nr:hypothetical protein [Enterococcus sp. 4G2_DIV0659]OTO08013.1 hypothetical protein A5880_002283 [Enterococcus sp. 4G2_DIV0659]
MKKIVLRSIILLSIAVLTACGNNQKKEVKTEVSSTAVSSTSATKESTKASKETKKSETPFAELAKAIQENIEAEKMSSIYANTDEQNFGTDEYKVRIKGYEYYEVEDFSRNLSIPFGDQTKNGGIVILEAEVENKSNESVYTASGFDLSVVGYDRSLTYTKSLINDDIEEEYPLFTSIMLKQKREVKAGEKVTGYITYAIRPEAVEKIKEYGEVTIETAGLYSKPDSYSKADAIYESEKVKIPVSTEGEQTVSESGEFYPDKASAANMGVKKMISAEKTEQTVDFEGIKVVLEGYQFVDFEPNEDTAARFKDFESGVVLLTAKVKIKNEGKEKVRLENMSGGLKIGSLGKVLSQGMLEEKPEKALVDIGEEGETYLVFALNKEDYDETFKKKEFELEVKLMDERFATMTKLGDITFKL